MMQTNDDTSPGFESETLSSRDDQWLWFLTKIKPYKIDKPYTPYTRLYQKVPEGFKPGRFKLYQLLPKSDT